MCVLHHDDYSLVSQASPIKGTSWEARNQAVQKLVNDSHSLQEESEDEGERDLAPIYTVERILCLWVSYSNEIHNSL